MTIGLTYDLRNDYLAEGFSEDDTAEFDREDTIQAIQQTLQDVGYETDRIGNIKQLTRRLAAGERWDMVFNIAEGFRGYGREAQVPALLDAYEIPYTFSDPLVLCLTLHKAMTKAVVRDLGIATPDFRVIESMSDLELFDLPFPVFAKPVAEGTSKGITAASKIWSENQLISVCARSLFAYKQPVLVEAFLPGREFTVGIVGTGKDARAIGVMEVILRDTAESDVYSYQNKERCDCRDAGRVDIRADANAVPNFMEVNPLAGLHPQHSDLPIIANLVGLPYRSLLEAILDSAFARVQGSEYREDRSAYMRR